MDHVLDNPVWNALISGNSHLATGNQQVKYFEKEVSPFVGLKDNSTSDFKLLHELVAGRDHVIFVSPNNMEIPGKWKVLYCMKGLQMIYNGQTVPTQVQHEIIPLTREHVPQMIALAEMTNPGPFASRTIDFGHYRGIFDGERLVAMAGQRLHVFDYMEISAVCTHPDYVGRGYARQLLLYQIHRIIGASGVPYLHVKQDNERAIKVYENLGFFTKKEMNFYVLKKEKE